MKKRVGGCDDPNCGCDTPALHDPVQALEFLAGRMEFAGVSEGVAKWYAQDIRDILEKFDITFTEKVHAL
jgi:hypothetical protein